MDHVPYPNNAATPKLEVPYICDGLEDYDGLGFFDYPIRRGWCQSANRLGWMNCSQELAAKRAQNWLYFGLLCEILGQKYRKDSFLKAADNGYFINTNRLLNYLNSWAIAINRTKMVRGDAWRIQTLKGSEDLFVEANLQAEILERAFASELLDRDFGSKILSSNFLQCQKTTLAIKILLQTMRIAASNIGGLGDSVSAPDSDKISPSRLTISLMVQRKLCSKQIQDFYENYSAAMNFYLAALPRPFREDNHRACSVDKCVANNVDESRYKTQHTQELCECQFVGPNPHKIRELITDGEIPLIALGVSPSGDPELEVVKAQPGVKYTAISHVWSGGLGNFQTNELPRCQLLHLHDVLVNFREFKPQESLPGPTIQWKRIQWGVLPRWTRFTVPVLRVPRLSLLNLQKTLLLRLGFPVNRRKGRIMLWMDTLCIVGEADSVVRAKAILKMALTYAAAESVLVLDPELQNISQKGLPQEQICAHVLCCAWLTRSWTMQEARLSRRWCAQLADGFFDPANAETMAYSNYNPGIYYKSAGNIIAEFAREAIHWYNSMPVMRRYSLFLHPDNVIEQPLVYFIQAWNELIKRQTSKPKDTHGIFANMLNLSASEVLALPHDQRMKAIFRAQEQIPLCLLYNPAPKIEDPHNRWIPDFPGGYALNLHYGVFNTNTGEILLNNWTATPIGFLANPSSPRTEKLRLVDSVTSEAIWIEHCHDGAVFNFEAPGTAAACYLLSDLKSARLHPRNSYLGARFGVQKREGMTVYLIYEHSFDFHLQHLEYSGSDPKDDVSDYTVVEAEKIAADQKFQLVCGEHLVYNATLSQTELDKTNTGSISEPVSWYQLQYKRELIEDKSTLGFEFYNTAWAIAITTIWSPLFVVSIATARPFKTHSTQFIGSCVAILVRSLYALVELGRLRKVIDNRAYEMWVQSFDETKNEQVEDLSTRSSLHFNLWGLSLPLTVAIALVITGVKRPAEAWLWWIGVTILIEVVFQVVIQILWRKTSMGRVAKVWLKKKGKW